MRLTNTLVGYSYWSGTQQEIELAFASFMLYTTPVITLAWPQVSAWRLARSQLLERAKSARPAEVASRLGCLHAQLMSSAELQVWVRVEDASAGDVQDALWRDRSLV